jgi:hypothetical protein
VNTINYATDNSHPVQSQLSQLRLTSKILKKLSLYFAASSLTMNGHDIPA